MANEMLTVCLPPDAGSDLRAALVAALAPYDMNGTHEPYQGEWDQWRIGRPGAEFMVVPGHEGDPRLIRDTTSFRGEARAWVPELCDGGPRGLLDFAAMRARADAVTTDHLLTLEGAWAYDYTLDMDSYLDELPPDTLVVRLRIHC
ncbi:hypothetical protein [Streptomyces diastatochromogenes]|uniref:hypothetical protein n=1 Tax=Streptomyces diastatochromogenes TaxID=42236 RepID=UPI003695B3C7